jgi:allophanate hydrolase
VTNADSLLIPYLHREYRTGRLTPLQLVRRLSALPDAAPRRNIWITRFDLEHVMPYLRALEGESIDTRPLYGIPFVIKDNIDLAGVATSAGCPEYTYVPARSAGVVQRLIDAGAIPLGKTNLDQFATGLVGTRSPYGACRNSVDAEYISGGSSSGSAVAVALGLASFALGTDTAGSGRIPAAFNNIIGLKPTRGRLSASGVVPACRSLDTVSIFALTSGDAGLVLDAAEGFDAADVYSRGLADAALTGKRFGVPRPGQLQFFGDGDYARLFDTAVQQLQSLGFTPVPMDLTPFLETARLLYEGPWVAERFAAVGEFLEKNPSAGLEVTRRIIMAGSQPSASAAFRGQYQLMALKRACEAQWAAMDFLALPTAATIYTVAAVAADPLRLNSNLGLYTNFVNLLDLAGVAVPAGFRADGLPFGLSLVGPASSERALLNVADRLHRACVTRLGATTQPLEPLEPLDAAPLAAAPRHGYIAVAVCGAHMQGLPLNHQLLERGAYLLRIARTAARYRLFALAGGPPQRPGLIRVSGDGAAIALEIWAIPQGQLGTFAAGIPAPLGLGTLELDDGTTCMGFICEGYASHSATDISGFGGWRGYLAAGGAGGAGWTQPP